MAPESSERVITLPPNLALHARPAGALVKTAMGFRSRVMLIAGEREADAKSILGVMALGAKGGTTLRIRADGEDAATAVEAIAACLAGEQ